MDGRAITFDFHNTIAQCDDWFQIEVHDLLGAYLRWRADGLGDEADPHLIAEANAAYRRLRQAIHQHGHEVAAEACISLVLHGLGIDEAPAIIDEGTEAIMRATLATASPVPGVLDTIAALDDEGVTLGIVSSAVYHPFLDWALEAFGVADRFDEVVTSASAGYYKSRPEIYWSALRSLEADPVGSLHLGDSFRFDVEGARRAGMSTAWYARATPATPPEGARPAEITLTSLVGADQPLLERLRAGEP